MMEAYASIYEKKGDCVDKKDKGMHNCAKKVCHEQYGEGECIFGQHAVPDENGFVSHYDVQFEHGIVENVSVEELEIITEGSHNEENHHYEGEMIDENRLQRAVDKVTRAAQSGLEGMGVKINRTERGTTTAEDQKRKVENNVKEDLDTFDIIKGHLIDEGYADTEESALAIMTNMSENWKESILEGLPRSVTVIPPSGPKGDQQMYKAGGGDAAMRQKGQTRDEVIKQGRKNYVKQRGDAARKDIKRQDAGEVSRVNGRIPEFRVD